MIASSRLDRNIAILVIASQLVLDIHCRRALFIGEKVVPSVGMAVASPATLLPMALVCVWGGGVWGVGVLGGGGV